MIVAALFSFRAPKRHEKNRASTNQSFPRHFVKPKCSGISYLSLFDAVILLLMFVPFFVELFMFLRTLPNSWVASNSMLISKMELVFGVESTNRSQFNSSSLSSRSTPFYFTNKSWSHFGNTWVSLYFLLVHVGSKFLLLWRRSFLVRVLRLCTRSKDIEYVGSLAKKVSVNLIKASVSCWIIVVTFLYIDGIFEAFNIWMQVLLVFSLLFYCGSYGFMSAINILMCKLMLMVIDKTNERVVSKKLSMAELMLHYEELVNVMARCNADSR